MQKTPRKQTLTQHWPLPGWPLKKLILNQISVTYKLKTVRNTKPF